MRRAWVAVFVVMLAAVIPQVGAQTPETKLTASDPSTRTIFGGRIAFDGTTLLVTSIGDQNETGAVYVFTRNETGGWSERQKLTANDAQEKADFGVSVSVSGDTAIVGQCDRDIYDESYGSVYFFRRNASGTWTQQAKLTPADITSDTFFGYSATISGDVAFTAAMDDDDRASRAGAVYVFARDAEGNWSQHQKITASDGATYDSFGSAIAVSGDTVIIGASGDDSTAGTSSGSAYVFTRNASGDWIEQQKLTAADAATGDYFGYAAAVSGNTAFIGLGRNNVEALKGGVAYVFVRDNAGHWAQQQRLVASDVSFQDDFGQSLAVSGDMAVVGAPRYAGGHGKAYVFTRNGSIWTERQKIDSQKDPYLGNALGFSAALQDGCVILGACWESEPFDDQGAVYVYDVAHKVAYQTDGTPGASLSGTRPQIVFHGANASPVAANVVAGGAKFVKWKKEGVDFSTANPLTLTNVTAATTLTATYTGGKLGAEGDWDLYR